MSNFCPDTGRQRWSLVSVRLFSRAVGRVGRCRQISLACVGSTHSALVTLGFPPLMVCVLSPSTLLRLQAALQGVGPELHSVPVFRYSTKAQTRLGCVLCLPRPSSSGSQELDGRSLPGCSAPYSLCGPSLSFLAGWSSAPCVSSGELISGCNPPGGCQPSRISGSLWLEAGSLFAVW